MKQQNRLMKLMCLVFALTILLPAIPAQASTDDLETGYHASTTFADDYAVGKAFDNDPATRWSACADQNQWICAIFENEVMISSVEILEFWDRMNSFEIQYLDENGSWQTCASKVIETPDTGIDTTHQLSFTPVRTTGMRLYIHDAPNWASIYEFKMFYGGIQIMNGKSAVGYHASTTFADEYATGKAFDNDPATRWSACADQNQWICAIFENEVVINSVEILEFWDRMNSFEIQYLDENGVWQTCASKVIDTPDTGIDTTHQLSFAPVRTTGMRLYIHDAPNWASIYEFKLFYDGIQVKDGKLPVGYYASTTFTDENAVGKAFDNDPATRWSACADQNQWICAIFENEVTIDSVEINEFWDRMNSFEIQYLDGNGIWQSCASKTIDGQDTGIDTTHLLSFDDVTTTGIRLYIHDAPGWPSIYEFKVFNDRPVAQVKEQSYTTVAEAIANAGGDVVKILVDSDEAITISGDVTIDLAGNHLSNVTVSAGKLQLIDTVGSGSANVTGAVETFTQADGKTYLVVGENGVYSAHCYDVSITHISLNPSKDALGYKAQVNGDEVVQAHVKSIGFNLWLDGGMVKTYEKDASNATLRLKGILAAGGGEMNINATAFVVLAVGEETHTETCSQQTTSMKQTLQMVNAAWDTYSEIQQEAVRALANQYALVTDDWNLDNIQPTIDIPIAS